MILVLSFEGYEQCTDPVIDWLLYRNANFIKISLRDLYEKNRVVFDIENKKLYYNDIDLTESVTCVYYRRFEDSIKLNLRKVYPVNQALYELQNELEDLVHYFYYLLKDKKWLPDLSKSDLDKLTALNIAQECGLKIPKSIVVTTKKDALSLITMVPSIIKPIRFSGYYRCGAHTYSMYTNLIQPTDMEKMKIQHFFPTLIQEKIEKDFEIRLFYLESQIYASAIMVGDKDYDDVKRCFDTEDISWIPFELPQEIILKIINFMNRAGLNTGSIDMMKDKNGNFVFIEVNPVGQFIAPSKRCNFNLEQKIANLLMEYDR